MAYSYDSIKTLFNSAYIACENNHNIYYQQYGNPSGIPVVILHGGPGAGMSLRTVGFFNPEKYHIIIFDQRGTGKSTPMGSLENNTTQDLIKDIEALRDFLKIKNLVICGGSWGTSLALLYAQQYPKKIIALLLRSVFLCRAEDVDALFSADGVAAKKHPNAWSDFTSVIPKQKHHALLKTYAELINHQDPKVYAPALHALSRWETICSSSKNFTKDELDIAEQDVEPWDIRILLHYILNSFFLKKSNYILSHSDKLTNIPIYIAHGEYDYASTINQSIELKKVLPHIKLHIIRNAGHSDSHPEIATKLTLLADQIAINYTRPD